MATAPSIYEEIEEAVLDLPTAERSRLATRLLESLEEDEEISAEWRKELRRRALDIDEGRAKLIPNEEVWKQVNERFDTNFKP